MQNTAVYVCHGRYRPEIDTPLSGALFRLDIEIVAVLPSNKFRGSLTKRAVNDNPGRSISRRHEVVVEQRAQPGYAHNIASSLLISYLVL